MSEVAVATRQQPMEITLPKKRILVTGGCGFLGSHVAKKLARAGYDVTVFDRDVSRVRAKFVDEVDGISVAVGDCCDRFGMLRIADKAKPEIVVHMAAEAVAKVCDLNPDNAMDSNLGGLSNALLAARSVGARRFVFVSSSFVYGDFQYIPADEEHPKNPKGIYGGTKLAGEAITKAFCERFGIAWVIVRPSAVYGAFDTNGRVVQRLLEHALAGEALRLDGVDSKLDFTYIEDAVEGIYLATLKPEAEGEIFNITRGEGRSLKELADIITGLVPSAKIVEGDANDTKPQRGALDISKAKSVLGYNPQWSLKQGVIKYHQWMKGQ